MNQLFSKFFKNEIPVVFHDKADKKKGDENCFKSRGQGAFLLSFDGRVIPLRKAKFLNGKY